VYRDIFVAANSLQSRTAHLKATARQQPDAFSGSAPITFPLMDVTKLPDMVHPGSANGPVLDQRYMDKITCWSQLQPNHVETSNQLLTGVHLFPPQEASYPTYIDFNAAMRMMEHHKSRKRMKFLRKLRRRQDKYQLRTWGHIVGNA
jgi:hypothetical protein